MRFAKFHFYAARLAVILLAGACVPLPAWANATVQASNFVEPASQGQPIRLSSAGLQSVAVARPADNVLQAETQRRWGQLVQYVRHYNRKLSEDQAGSIAQAILQLSSRYNVDFRLVAGLIAVESGFRSDVVSSSGAIGMGQLKPDTATWLGVADPYDPVDNIGGTARFLSWLVTRYGGSLDHALSAYYQGPGSVDRQGITPVCEPYLWKINKALAELL